MELWRGLIHILSFAIIHFANYGFGLHPMFGTLMIVDRIDLQI